MKKTLLSLGIASLLIASASPLKAQAFEKGKSNIQVGYGIGTVVGAIFSTWEDDPFFTNISSSAFGPIYAKYEYAASDKIGIGVNFAYASNSLSYTEEDWDGLGNDVNASIDRTTMSINARMNIHFGNSDRFDPYWGFGFGYRTASWSFDYDDDNYNGNETFSNPLPLGFETTLGARFYLTDNIGLYGEFGAAKSVLQFGLAASF